MAVDEAILSAVTAKEVLPTLRLYQWRPPCLSLGYAQKSSDVDFARLEQNGWEVVRRLTGGRAILHTDELTYSVILPADHPLVAGDVIESYRRISQALAAGLNILGLQPEADKRAERGNFSGAVCFETPSHYEITVHGRKLVGSAQVRRKGGVLQHGSLPLCGDLTRICDALYYPDETSREQAKAQVRSRAITLAEAIGQTLHWQTVADAIVQGFRQTFDLELIPSTLSEVESQRALHYITEVYSNDIWTLRR
jgi:lipoate-protein ligase A